VLVEHLLRRKYGRDPLEHMCVGSVGGSGEVKQSFRFLNMWRLGTNKLNPTLTPSTPQLSLQPLNP